MGMVGTDFFADMRSMFVRYYRRLWVYKASKPSAGAGKNGRPLPLYNWRNTVG